MAYSIHNIYPKTSTRPDEAEQIEIARRRLMQQSEKVRTGKNLFPSFTAHRLAQTALYFANSRASSFEKVHTLNAVEANFRARGVNERTMRTMAGLSQRALQEAFPPTDDPAINELNRLDLLARRSAIEHTTSNTPFPVALDQAWTDLGHPMEPLLKKTERIILYGDFLEQATGVIGDPTEDGTGPVSLLK